MDRPRRWMLPGGGLPARGSLSPGDDRLPRGEPRDSLPGDEGLAAKKGENRHGKDKNGNGKPGGPSPLPSLTRGRPVPPAPPPPPPSPGRPPVPPPPGAGRRRVAPGEGVRGCSRPTRPTLPPPRRPSRAPASVHSYVRVPWCRPSVSAEDAPRAPALLRDARPPFARPLAGGGSGAGNRSRASRGLGRTSCPGWDPGRPALHRGGPPPDDVHPGGAIPRERCAYPGMPPLDLEKSSEAISLGSAPDPGRPG